MQTRKRICERCGLEIEKNDPHIQYTLTGQSHTANRCVELLKKLLEEKRSKRAQQ